MSIPVLGPVIEGGALKDMFLKRILYESKKGFLKDIGQYKSIYERVKERVEQVAGELRPRPYSPVYTA